MVFAHSHYGLVGGGVLLILAFILSASVNSNVFQLPGDCRRSLASLAIVMLWIGGFLFFYGPQTFRNAAFPLLFLVLLVPFPDGLLDIVIVALQKGSFISTVWILKIFGVETSTAGFVIFLPGLAIEVAKECSGIRSSMSLFITSLLLGHFFLNTTINKCVLSLTAIPIAIFKNAVRIAVISLGTIYWDEGFMTGRLHLEGGIFFFLLGLALLAVVTQLLRSRERFGKSAGPASGGQVSP
jgi:exosortase